MYDYNKVYLETKPLRDQLNATQKLLAEKTAFLKTKKDALDEVNRKIKALEDLYNEKITLKEELQKKMIECQVKLERAQKLTVGLSDEQKRWGHDVTLLRSKEALLAGDSTVGSAMIAYAGPFTSAFRNKLETQWVQELDVQGILHSENVTMRQFLGVPVQIQKWNINGLPKDDSSTENGIIINKTRRWPLMIDPQNQANKFIKSLGKEHLEGTDVVKINEATLMRTIELAVQFGKWVLLENVGKELDPSLEPILLQQVTKQGSSLTITLGDKALPYSESFKLFLTTTLPNPHYSPETFVKVTIINFAITPSGLEEQMLAQIVALENPQMEAKKLEIVLKNAQDKQTLLNIEDKILNSLSATEGDIGEVLKDETLINELQNSKRTSTEINKRVEESKITEEQIDAAREGYRPVAFRASLLFFCILDLAFIDPMYQYSLQWFTNLFIMSVENSPASQVLADRLVSLNNYLTYSLYENICRSLFEKHKLLFSLMLTIKILQADNLINEVEWRYFLTGAAGEIKIEPNPTTWISENAWPDFYRQIFGLSRLEVFNGADLQFLKKSDDFKAIFDSQTP